MLRNIRVVSRALSAAARPATISGGRYAAQYARPALASSFRLYSSSAPSSTAADAELVAALKAEMKIEQESLADEDQDQDPAQFANFLKNQGYELVHNEGAEEVQIVRAAGDETIRIFFNVSDVLNSDSILDDIDESVESSHQEHAEVEEEMDLKDDFEAPIRLNIVVEKPAGAASIEAIVQDDLIIVESLTPYDSSKIALDESPEADYKRRATYQGPPFSVLDPQVQSAVQSFLESRNINGDLALFISEYSSYRENQEYVQWLGKLAKIFG